MGSMGGVGAAGVGGLGMDPRYMMNDPRLSKRAAEGVYAASQPEESYDKRPRTEVAMLDRFPRTWQGQLALKSFVVSVDLHMISGNTEFLEILPRDEPLKLTQRMRLENSQLATVSQQLEAGNANFCMLLALPKDRLEQHAQVLRTNFVNYLSEKMAAGIVHFETGTVYIFPPCEFASAHLSKAAPSLPPDALNGNLLFILAPYTPQ